MHQIDEALHPEFVSVLKHTPSESIFATVATSSTAEYEPGPLPASLAVIAVLSVLQPSLSRSVIPRGCDISSRSRSAHC